MAASTAVLLHPTHAAGWEEGIVADAALGLDYSSALPGHVVLEHRRVKALRHGDKRSDKTAAAGNAVAEGSAAAGAGVAVGGGIEIEVHEGQCDWQE